jgi:hypothetical protein
MRILFILTLIALALQSASQHRELVPHFPVPQSGPEQLLETIDLSVPPIRCTLHPVTSINKSSDHYIDTLYPVLHATGFYDVMDSDSAYFISGYGCNPRFQNLDPDNPTMLIRMKVSYSGQVLWTRVDSLMRGDHFTMYNTSLIKTSDDHYLQMGIVVNDYNNWKDYMIRLPVYTKFNSDGDIIWQRLYTDTTGWRGGDWPQDIIPEDDGGFTVAALTPSVSKTYSLDTNIHWWYNDTTYVSLIRYDSLGNEVHRKSHVIGGELVPMTIGLIMKQDDGGYVVGGVNKFNGNLNPGEYYLLKTDSLFNWEWIRKFGQTVYYIPFMKIIKRPDNGYFFSCSRSDTPIVVSGSSSYHSIYHQIGLMDSAYGVISDTVFDIKLAQVGTSGSYYRSIGIVKGLTYSKNGNYVISDEIGPYGAHLLQIDTSFHLKWNRWIAYYPYWSEKPFKMRSAHDGGNLIVGMTMIIGAGGWFVKTDTLGCALPNCADTLYHIGIKTVEQGKQELFVYPNPTRDFLNIRTKDNTTMPQGTLQIYNLHGVLQQEIAIPAYQNQIQLNLSHLPAGLYMGRIASFGGGGGGFKFVKE